MDICTNACERNVANNEKVRNIVNNRRTRLPPVAPHVTHYPTSAPKRSRRCWTNGMDQAGTLSLGKALASTSAMRSCLTELLPEKLLSAQLFKCQEDDIDPIYILYFRSQDFSTCSLLVASLFVCGDVLRIALIVLMKYNCCPFRQLVILFRS